MKKIQAYSDGDLLAETRLLVEKERLTTLELIECLAEVEARMLYATLGYSSLWNFCIEYLKLSEGATQRRIQAMRLSKQVPQVKGSIAEGSLSLSNASKLESFFKSEKKSGRAQTLEQKQQTIEKMKGLSQSECEKKLFEISPQFETAQKEVLQPVAVDQTLLKLILDSATAEKLNLLRDRLAHQLPSATYTDIITFLIEDKLNRIEQKFQGKEPQSEVQLVHPTESRSTAAAIVTPQVSDPEITRSKPIPSRRKTIPISTLRDLAKRSDLKCEYTSPDGKRCLSSYALEVDHIQPVVFGGTNELSNLRHSCKVHNGLFSKQAFGTDFMKRYLPRLRN
jgi:5-methylcytosine-specific restriction endonuclease McrA